MQLILRERNVRSWLRRCGKLAKKNVPRRGNEQILRNGRINSNAKILRSPNVIRYTKLRKTQRYRVNRRYRILGQSSSQRVSRPPSQVISSRLVRLGLTIVLEQLLGVLKTLNQFLYIFAFRVSFLLNQVLYLSSLFPPVDNSLNLVMRFLCFWFDVYWPRWVNVWCQL